MFRVSQEKPS